MMINIRPYLDIDQKRPTLNKFVCFLSMRQCARACHNSMSVDGSLGTNCCIMVDILSIYMYLTGKRRCIDRLYSEQYRYVQPEKNDALHKAKKNSYKEGMREIAHTIRLEFWQQTGLIVHVENKWRSGLYILTTLCNCAVEIPLLTYFIILKIPLKNK